MNRRRTRVMALGAALAGLLLTATAVSPEAVTAAPGPCGPTIYKSNGAPWTCTFADDFNGSVLDGRKWLPQRTATTGMRVGRECLVNSSRNVSVSGGRLHLTTRKEAAWFRCKSPFGSYSSQWTSGGVTTNGRFSQTYGRFEFRAKFPAAKVRGLQGALWLYPTKMTYGAWPASGEIDVAEFYSQYPDRTIPYIHYRSSNRGSPVTNLSCKLDPSVFHTYVAVWTPRSITISNDGVVCVSHTIKPSGGLFRHLTAPQPFDQPFAVLITQVLGTGTNAFKSTATPLPATTDVDWVRVWS